MIEYEDMLSPFCETAVVLGRFALTQFSGMCEMEQFRIGLVFTDDQDAESGPWYCLLDETQKHVVDFTRFEVAEKPSLKDVEAMIACIKSRDPLFVAVTGDSALIDAAKLAYLSFQSGVSPQKIMEKGDDALKKGDYKRVVVLPSSLGVGAETSPYMMIRSTPESVPSVVKCDAVRPQYVFFKSELTRTLSKERILTAALGTLACCVEGYLHPNTEKNKTLSRTAKRMIGLIIEKLPAKLENPGDMDATYALATASSFSGFLMAENGPSICSLIGMGVEKACDPELAAAISLPALWEQLLTDKKAQTRTRKLAEFLNATGDSPKAVLKAYQDFLKKLTISSTLKKACGRHKVNLSDIVKNAMNYEETIHAAHGFTKGDVEKKLTHVVENAWG